MLRADEKGNSDLERWWWWWWWWWGCWVMGCCRVRVGSEWVKMGCWELFKVVSARALTGRFAGGGHFSFFSGALSVCGVADWALALGSDAGAAFL